jgi:phospholipid/cholesterol/gamma-HCH transport system ATP-binding protein
MIRLVNLHKSFGRQNVLTGVNLEIPDHAIYVIVGGSGVGKSCLLKHLIGLMRPDNGQVWVDDVEITALGRRALNRIRNRFGMLFQGGALFDSMSVYDNLAFPLREKTHKGEVEI